MTSKPTYEELLGICQELQAQVEKRVGMHQQLINAKQELDRKLANFHAIQEYGQQALVLDTLEEFLQLTLELFARVFQQPKVAFYQYNEGYDSAHLFAQFGFFGEALPQNLTLSTKELQFPFILCADQSEPLPFVELLPFQEALVGGYMIQKRNGFPGGLFFCGFTSAEADYMLHIGEDEVVAYAILVQKASLYLSHIHTLRYLQEEVIVRRQAEEELLDYQARLEAHREELERRVKKRTEDLEQSNAQLKQEIAERKLVEEELRNSNAELEQFVFVASHDLKTPLRNIGSFAQLISRRYGEELPAPALEYLSYVLNGARRLNDVINDLLAFAGVSNESSEPAEVDLNEVVQRVVANLRPELEQENGHIVYAKLPVVKGHESHFEQLFQNLLENAMKFRKPNQAPHVEISCRQEGKQFTCRVKDNGIGLAKEYEDKVFTLFQRLHTDETYPGTGLGLSICKKIVAQMGGDIWYESHGDGTTFLFTISQ